MSFLTNQRDTDLLILKELDDKDLLNISLVNKRANILFNNENFWRTRLIEKYECHHISEYRSSKSFYFLIKKYYIHSKSLNNDPGLIMCKASNAGYMDVVKFMIEKGATNFIWCFLNAAEKGHLDILKIMIDKSTHLDISIYFNVAIKEATENGHLHIVEYLKSKKK